MYELSRGPLVWIAFAILLIGSAYRIIAISRMAKKDKVSAEKLLPKQKKAPVEEAPDQFDVEQARQALQQMSGRPTTPQERMSIIEARLRLQEAKTRELEAKENDEVFWDGEEGRKLDEQLSGSNMAEYFAWVQEEEETSP